MKNRTLAVFGVFFKVLNIVIALISLAGLVLLVLSQFNFDFEPIKYIYIVMYELLIPFIYLFFGNFNTLTTNNIVSLGIGICVMFLILSIIAIRDISRATSYLSHPNKKVSYIWSGVYSIILVIVYGFSLIMTGVEYNKINTFITQNSVGSISSSAVILKGVILASIALIISLATFFALLASRTKGVKRAREVGGTLFFYSSQYDEQIQENKPSAQMEEDNSSNKTIDESTESSPQAKNLINRIMELNKMLANGEIDDVEYTRLRQTAIRRYKK